MSEYISIAFKVCGLSVVDFSLSIIGVMMAADWRSFVAFTS